MQMRPFSDLRAITSLGLAYIAFTCSCATIIENESTQTRELGIRAGPPEVHESRVIHACTFAEDSLGCQVNNERFCRDTEIHLSETVARTERGLSLEDEFIVAGVGFGLGSLLLGGGVAMIAASDDITRGLNDSRDPNSEEVSGGGVIGGGAALTAFGALLLIGGTVEAGRTFDSEDRAVSEKTVVTGDPVSCGRTPAANVELRLDVGTNALRKATDGSGWAHFDLTHVPRILPRRGEAWGDIALVGGNLGDGDPVALNPPPTFFLPQLLSELDSEQIARFRARFSDPSALQTLDAALEERRRGELIAQAEELLQAPIERTSAAHTVGEIERVLGELRELEDPEPRVEARLQARLKQARKVTEEVALGLLRKETETALREGTWTELAALEKALTKEGQARLAAQVRARMRALERETLLALIGEGLESGELCSTLMEFRSKVQDDNKTLDVELLRITNDDGGLATSVHNLMGAGLGLKVTRSQVLDAELLEASLCAAETISLILLAVSKEGVRFPRWKLRVKAKLLQAKARTDSFGNVVPLAPRALRTGLLRVSHQRLMRNNWPNIRQMVGGGAYRYSKSRRVVRRFGIKWHTSGRRR